MPSGLQNLGNTCYIDSALQLLFLLDVANLKSNDSIVSGLVQAANEAHNGETVTPRNFVNQLIERFPRHFSPGQQGDSSDVISCTLECIYEATNKARENEPSLINGDTEAIRELKAYENEMDSDFEKTVLITQIDSIMCKCGETIQLSTFSGLLYLDFPHSEQDYKKREGTEQYNLSCLCHNKKKHPKSQNEDLSMSDAPSPNAESASEITVLLFGGDEGAQSLSFPESTGYSFIYNTIIQTLIQNKDGEESIECAKSFDLLFYSYHFNQFGLDEILAKISEADAVNEGEGAKPGKGITKGESEEERPIKQSEGQNTADAVNRAKESEVEPKETEELQNSYNNIESDSDDQQVEKDQLDQKAQNADLEADNAENEPVSKAVNEAPEREVVANLGEDNKSGKASKSPGAAPNEAAERPEESSPNYEVVDRYGEDNEELNAVSTAEEGGNDNKLEHGAEEVPNITSDISWFLGKKTIIAVAARKFGDESNIKKQEYSLIALNLLNKERLSLPFVLPHKEAEEYNGKGLSPFTKSLLFCYKSLFSDEANELFEENKCFDVMSETEYGTTMFISTHANSDVTSDILKLSNENRPKRINPENSVTVQYCLQLFEKPSPVEGWECENCSAIATVHKQTLIEDVSQYLIVVMKRFKTEPGYYGHASLQKDNTPLEFQSTLCVHDKICELIGFSCHHGSLGGGHYYACVKENGAWYNCNDSWVSKIDIEQVENEIRNAQSLVYRRL